MAAVDPQVSVIIPCYNASATLGLQLQALELQSDAPSFEVVLVDNRSQDNLSLLVEPYQVRGLPIRIVEANALQGTSYARNVGIGAARAQLLMFCDADDVVSEWWLAQGLRTFDEAPLWSGSAVSVPAHEFGNSVEMLRERIGDSPEWESPRHVQTEAAFPILMGSNFGCRRDVLIELGGFDVSVPVRGEDNELGLRASAAGWSIPISPTVRIAYRVRTEPASRRRYARADARAHAQLARRYDRLSASPFRPWPEDLARTIADGPRRVWTREGREAWLERLARTRGWVSGNIQALLKGVPEPRLGVGLREARGTQGTPTFKESE